MATILGVLLYFGVVLALGTYYSTRNKNLSEYILLVLAATICG